MLFLICLFEERQYYISDVENTQCKPPGSDRGGKEYFSCVVNGDPKFVAECHPLGSPGAFELKCADS